MRKGCMAGFLASALLFVSHSLLTNRSVQARVAFCSFGL